MIQEETIKQGKILLVDDEVSSLCLLENVLMRLGFPFTRKLIDSKRILAEFDSYQPDLVITDIEMPGLDGIKLVEKLRAHLPRESNLPILVLTGKSDSQTKRQALLAGATDILFKPFECSEMLMRIRNLLCTRFQHLEIQQQNHLLEMKVVARTSELEIALNELKASQRQAVQQERLRAFGEMAGGIVHDFNNALMSIIGYSELLMQDGSLADDRDLLRDYLKTINTAGRDASHVVSRLRDFYRPREEGDRFDGVNVNDLIEEVVSLTKPKWHSHALETGRTVNVELELQKVPLAFGNGAELREILTNLVFNAVDALPSGGTITLRTQPYEDGLKIEVADTGTGMSEEVRQRCLEPFFSTKGEKGSGLGLAMAFGIIRRHGGTLDIESIQGVGTTFRIALPSCSPANGRKISHQTGNVRTLNVLVVDDEQHTRNVVARYLLNDGHRVVTAVNGSDALQRLMVGDFDLLITDHGMPGMNGFQLAEIVKRIDPKKAVILLTGFAFDPSQKPESVDCVLKKPLVPDDLRTTLHSMFGSEGVVIRAEFAEEQKANVSSQENLAAPKIVNF